MTEPKSKAEIEELAEPMTIGVEAYIQRSMPAPTQVVAQGGQQVGRVEEPRGGQLSDLRHPHDSIIVVRTGPTEFKAHHNVCMHRGRRLVDTPDGAKKCLRRARKSFVCASRLGVRPDGACTHIREQDDWKGALTPENASHVVV
jgi:hypothetical protein